MSPIASSVNHCYNYEGAMKKSWDNLRAFIAARGPPMCSPLFLPKESSHKFAVVFVNVMYF